MTDQFASSSAGAAAPRRETEEIVAMIETMADSHYLRDIRGDLAHRDWLALAATIRKNIERSYTSPQAEHRAE